MTYKRFGMVSLVLVSALFVCIAGQACFAGNLLVNPGFEAEHNWQFGTNAGTWQKMGWTMETASSPIWISSSYGVLPIHSGTDSMGHCYWGTGQGHLMTWQESGVAPGAEYTASCWVCAWGDGTSSGGLTAAPFGSNEGDCASIRIIQYDASGAVISDAKVAELTAQPSPDKQYVQLCGTFTTTPSTRKVRYCLDTLISEQYVHYLNGTFVYYDDCVLDGPAPPATITGTVTGGGSALPGATVADLTQSIATTTDASGAYTLTGLAGGNNEPIRASKDGYYAQRKIRTWIAGDNLSINYDLEPVGNNLMVNAGFDDIWNNGWKSETAGADVWVINESYSAQYPFPVYYDSGEEALALFVPLDGPDRQAWVYQEIPVRPNSDYTARCRFIAGYGAGTLPASHWGTPGDGCDAGLYVQEYGMSGEPVGNQLMAASAETGAWETLELPFRTGAGTRYVRVGANAKLAYAYNVNLERAVFDSFELNGTAGDPLPAFFGAVYSDGVPVPGAGVECMGTPYHTVTDANGYYELNVPPGKYNMRAGKTGEYYNQRKWDVVTGTAVSFDLMPKNLLANAQFDDQDSYPNGIVIDPGWSQNWDGGGAYIQIGPFNPRSGSHSLCFRTHNLGASTCWAWQDVSAQPGQSYSARLWAYGYGEGWAEALGDYISLSVEEYDASGSLIPASHTINIPFSQENTDTWIEVNLPSFTTQPQTATLRFRLDGLLLGNCEANIDDCALIGPAGPSALQGTVQDYAGVMLLSGATVDAINVSAIPQTTQTTLTSSTGNYSFSSPLFSDYFVVRATKPGYYAQRKNSWTNLPSTVDFGLVSSQGNLLVNAGMDDGWNSGGWVDAPETANTYYIAESFTSSWGGPVFYHSGIHAVSLVAEFGGAGTWYQQVPVKPETEYTASGWFRPGTDPRYFHIWGDPADEQKACLYVEQFTSEGTAIEGTKQLIDFIEDPENWDQKSVTFTTTPETALVRVGGYCNMVDRYTASLSRPVFDDFALIGPAPTIPLSDAKSRADGTLVSITGQVVTAAFTGYFYVEEPDRSSGIRVTGSAAVGSTVSVTGPITTIDGERVIDATSVSGVGSGSVDPLGITGDAAARDGLTRGLLVKAWGRVTETGSGWFTMSDGSATALKVYGAASTGQYVAVTGALGAESTGSGVISVLRATHVDPVDEN